MICDINGIELPDRIFLTSMATEGNTNGKEKGEKNWVVNVKAMPAFAENVNSSRVSWPDKGLAECWPRDKEIRL